jgi:hypothetical protein
MGSQYTFDEWCRLKGSATLSASAAAAPAATPSVWCCTWASCVEMCIEPEETPEPTVQPNPLPIVTGRRQRRISPSPQRAGPAVISI